MTPPADTELTEEELEVARILRKLPKLVLDADARRLPDFLRWGARRRRSALGDDNSLFSLPPPPPAPISPPPDGNDEKKDGTRGGGATSSPATPLSFPASGGEEPDSQPPPPPSSSSVKAFKNPKRHKEWVKEQGLLIVSLSDQKVHLQRSIEEYNALYKKLKARNSWLRDLQSKVAREAMEEVGQSGTQREDGSLGVATLGPTSVQSPAARPMVEPHHQAYRLEMGRAVQPPLVDRTSIEGRELGAEKWASLDLNARPEEEKWGIEEEEWEQLQSSAYKAAMSAQARKRRLEIQREKNPYSSSTLFTRIHRLPRLR
ncbi:bromodomain testis-specific protein [Cocos nucifera]|uniref:Bromodomain testis-specific protein n=1 Tax=Cocos nucifera TaxID=13894 RepID=A0A8K0IIR5_COCNU|nr:bromodomain testis-specific protein [Cocos nucifera]